MNSTMNIQSIQENKINGGMPSLEIDSHHAVSPFEFFPTWFFYTPVVMQSLMLGLRYGDLRLPLIANPSIKLSGMVGESKHDILQLAGSVAKPWISPYITLTRTDEPTDKQVQQALQGLANENLTFPLVAKPDMGCRGVGVKLVNNTQQLAEYIDSFPKNVTFLLQQKAPYHAEAGVFYIRYPGEQKGKIISMTLKYNPSVVGNGIHTLRELIERCPRAGQLTHLYLPRHQEKLDWVLPDGEEYQLAFAGSHSRGSIFRNGNSFITDALTEKLDEILADVDEYYYGRLDIKFQNINQFMQGKNFTILEINGASSEATHIWDRNTPLKEIFSTLLYQYRILFEIGAKQKARGFRPDSIRSLLKAWKQERDLTKHYPTTD
ncbi:D-alanine--D-alanine ligase [Marinomonas piezotolerans]|uniref:D-alanine--D-alanine ligase n=1 Tax=Marinomonas piezotolerans TaxID=2213058 RepID=A0A370UD12_9GAMM|nr:D-alanine--D-alanine ligase [Marinomonas piezotolerans]RDL45631.1 D-alanine--D-alanine ligase [Marinomonas piezotolerans]